MKQIYIKELNKYLGKYKTQLILVYLMIVGYNLLVVVTGYFPKIIIDVIIPENSWNNLYILTGAILVVLVLIKVFMKYRMRLMSNILNDLLYSLRKNYFEKIQKTNHRSLSKKKFAQLYTNLISDTEEISNSFSALVNSISEVLFFIIAFVVLMYINHVITLLLILLCVIIYIVVMMLGKIISKRKSAYAHSNYELNMTLENILNGVKDIIIYQASDYFLHGLNHAGKDVLKNKITYNIIPVIIQAMVDFSVYLSYLVIFLISHFLYERQLTTPGQIIVYLVFMPMLWSRFLAAINIYTNYINLSVYARRFFENIIDDGCEEITESIEASLSKISELENRPSIDIKNITFSYNDEKIIFDDFSANLSKSGVYCIKGASGKGKTTLFNLLHKIYRVQDGEIIVNGKDIRAYSQKDIRNTIGIVHQNIFIIEDTIMNNLTFGDASITEKKIIQTSKRIGVHKYISELPQGYYTHISNSDQSISLGIKRLITILRTLCWDFNILLFDEVTSNVDSYTSELFHRLIKKISQEKICLFITHKKSDYRDMYNIIEIK